MTYNEPLVPKHGGYRKLKSFQVAQLVYDVTVRFCDRYVSPGSRTRDQMVQAARSGVQNIAEGSQASGTSRKMELKLTNVARASLEELRLDYEDFLRQRGLHLLPPDHPALRRFKAMRCSTLDEVRMWVAEEGGNSEEHGRTRTNTDEHGQPAGANTPVSSNQAAATSHSMPPNPGATASRAVPATPAAATGHSMPPNPGATASRAVPATPAAATGRAVTTNPAAADRSVPVRVGPCSSVPSQPPQSPGPGPIATSALVANAALSLLNLCCYLLDRQLAAQAAAFEQEGGFTERLYRVRTARRAHHP